MNHKSTKAISSIVAVLVVLIIIVGAVAAYEAVQLQSVPATTSTSTSALTTYTIGAAYPETGDGSVCGQGQAASVKLAIKNINSLLAQTGSNYRFAINIIDDKTDPTAALQAAKTLHETYGVQVVMTSGSFETAGVLSYANSARLLLASGASTGISLAIANDYLFRVIGSDNGFVRAAVNTIYQQGYRKIGIMYENGPYGTSIGTTFPTLWAQKPGTSFTGLSYALSQADYSAEVTQLSQKMASLGVDNTTAWIWIGEQDDGIKIFSRAATDSVLGTMKLYVYDDPVFGAALYPPTAPATVPQYLMNVAHVQGFHNSVAEIHNIFTDQYYNNLPSPACYANPYAYDAVWLISKAMMLCACNNATTLKNIFPRAAMNFVGVTGPLQFDAAGDSLYTNYATYQVGHMTNGTWFVYENGFYNAATAAWQPVSNGPNLSSFGSSP